MNHSHRSATARAAITVAAVGLLGASACRNEQPPELVSAPPVAVARVVAIDLQERIEATGELIAPSRAVVAAETGGRITRIVADEGAAVERDAPVVAIDPERKELELEAARARAQEAEAALARERREARRMGSLQRSSVASKAQLDRAQTTLRLAESRATVARAQLGVAQRALADADVGAPFAGLIARRHVSEGEYVTPGQALFELVSLDPIEVEFHLAERDSGRVKLDQMVDVRVSPYPERVFPARVTVISPTIDPATRTLRVKAQLPNADGALRPGLFARADLGIARREGVAMIAEEAVLQRSDGAVVFKLVDGDRVERRVVELGTFAPGRVEIARGLEVGDRVVTRGHAALIDGSAVQVRQPDGGPVETDVAVGPGGSEVQRP